MDHAGVGSAVATAIPREAASTTGDARARRKGKIRRAATTKTKAWDKIAGKIATIARGTIATAPARSMRGAARATAAIGSAAAMTGAAPAMMIADVTGNVRT